MTGTQLNKKNLNENKIRKYSENLFKR